MRYWLTRLGGAVVLLLVISMLTFGAMNVLGDPLFNILGVTAAATDEDSLQKIEAAKEEYNLDEPLPVRYVIWLGGFVQGDFGVQFSEDGQPPVRDLIVERLPRTLSLVILAQLMALVISLPWALWSASRANSRADKVSTVGAFLMISVPNFALAIIVSYFLSIKLGWFPLVYQADDPFLSRLHTMILPALTLAIPAAAVYQRLLRTDLITTLQEDFILTARAKGVSRRSILVQTRIAPVAVLLRHRLRHHDGRADRWRARRREHLPHPRPRQGDRGSGAARGLPGRSGDRHDRLGGLRLPQPDHRPHLFAHRPTGPQIGVRR